MEKGQVTKIRINPLLLIWSFFVGWNMCRMAQLSLFTTIDGINLQN